VAGVRLVPYTADAAALWETRVGMGGEGIVLKERTSVYRPGIRSPAWLKLKPKLTLEVVVTGGSAERIRWGDWGEAVMLELRYVHPRTGADVEIRQGRARAARSPVRVEDRGAGPVRVLGRDAERDAVASGDASWLPLLSYIFSLNIWRSVLARPGRPSNSRAVSGVFIKWLNPGWDFSSGDVRSRKPMDQSGN
jgi:hypothetical protein